MNKATINKRLISIKFKNLFNNYAKETITIQTYQFYIILFLVTAIKRKN